MSTHTPGPWKFEMGGVERNWPQVITLGIHSQQIVARTYDPDAEKNARLIAAAPDLLAFTQSIAGCVMVSESDKGIACMNPNEIIDRWILAARAALAKATGGGN